MEDDLRDLYQDVILDHGRHPRNRRRPAHANRQARGENPLCGDSIGVFLEVGDGGRIRDAGFEGHGCAISMASASLMTEALKGRTEAEAREMLDHFRAMVTGGEPAGDVESLRPLSGVREYPVRIKCATLAWHAMAAALEGGGRATTE